MVFRGDWFTGFSRVEHVRRVERMRRNVEKLEDFLKLGLGILEEVFGLDVQDLRAREEAVEAADLLAVKAAVDVRVKPVLGGEGRAKAVRLFADRLGERKG